MSSYATRSNPSRSNSNRREKIIVGFEPVTVKLDGPAEGMEVQSNFGSGVEYHYFCNDNTAHFYLPGSGRNAIVQSGARQGDEIEICKSRSGYIVTLLSDSREVTPIVSAARPVATVQSAPQSMQSPLEEIAFTAMRMSAAVIKRTREHCAAVGLPEEYFEDVRSLAIHWLIAREKKAGN